MLRWWRPTIFFLFGILSTSLSAASFYSSYFFFFNAHVEYGPSGILNNEAVHHFVFCFLYGACCPWTWSGIFLYLSFYHHLFIFFKNILVIQSARISSRPKSFTRNGIFCFVFLSVGFFSAPEGKRHSHWSETNGNNKFGYTFFSWAAYEFPVSATAPNSRL